MVKEINIKKNLLNENFLGCSKVSKKLDGSQHSNITKQMTFSEIVEKAPEAVEVLFGNGMHCIGCGMAGMETLEQGALAHGLDPDKLILEINKKILKKNIKKSK